MTLQVAACEMMKMLAVLLQATGLLSQGVVWSGVLLLWWWPLLPPALHDGNECGPSWATAESLHAAPPCRCPCLHLSPWLQEVNGAGLPSAVSTGERVLAVGQAEGELQSHPCLDGLPMLSPVHRFQVQGDKPAEG